MRPAKGLELNIIKKIVSALVWIILFSIILSVLLIFVFRVIPGLEHEIIKNALIAFFAAFFGAFFAFSLEQFGKYAEKTRNHKANHINSLVKIERILNRAIDTIDYLTSARFGQMSVFLKLQIICNNLKLGGMHDNREKWFNKQWEKDKKNPGSGNPVETIKTKMREPDKVGRRGRIRPNASKTRWFCPSESKPTRFPDSLSSSRSRARLASKRFFPASSLILMSI